MNAVRNAWRRMLALDDRVFAGALVAVLVLSYAACFSRYRVEELDDAFYNSFVYGKSQLGIEDDIVFHEISVPHYLMASQIAIHAPVLRAWGWKRPVTRALNLAWVALSAVLWLPIAKRLLQRDDAWVPAFVAALFLCETVMGTAYKARPDAMALFFASLAILCYLRRWPLLAGLAVIVGMETHPIAVVSLAYMAGFALHRLFTAPERAWIPRELAWGTLGVLLGLPYYFWLHPISPAQVYTFLSTAKHGYNPLYTHFFDRAGYRFLPELAVFLAAFGIALAHWRTFIRRPAFLVFCTVAASNFLIRRDVMHYATFFYPALVALAVDVALQLKWQKQLALAAALYFLAFYSALAWHFRKVDDAGLVRSYTAMATHVPAGAVVFGPPNAWFVFKERLRGTIYTPWQDEVLGPAYLVHNEAYPTPEAFLACVEPASSWGLVDQFTYADSPIKLYTIQVKACSRDPHSSCPCGAARNTNPSP